MSTESGAHSLRSTKEYKAILHQIAFAKQKLLAPEIPHQLKVISYIRINCSAMRKMNRIESIGRGQKHANMSYLDLLRSLSKHDREWWDKCDITNEGELTSADPTIGVLLHPLSIFIKKQLEPLAA